MKLNRVKAASVWETITLSTGETFQVLVKPVTPASRLREEAFLAGIDDGTPLSIADSHASRLWQMVLAVIVDWKDITDEGDKPVPFSELALQDLVAASTEAFRKIENLAWRAFYPPRVFAEPVGNGPLLPTGSGESGASGSTSTDATSDPTPPSSNGLDGGS